MVVIFILFYNRISALIIFPAMSAMRLFRSFRSVTVCSAVMSVCCAQGLEFVWRGEHAWPEDYPDETTDITVTGRLEVYQEDGCNYLHLVDAEVLWEASAG